ncbi:hypothetical protein DFP72DRAFT_994736 [Ephemerocybe angulata]|uniref:CxC2-like cysteine cluster KDZ transposase-associated domain-containing protein n=1 Tax=Ephemerocybe angulata TaxID=980116 RepID=A0A8H6H9S4_9AGAR|nr:hypothetical protein DFP72DRAFT_994736 [Tulosesus angulatus]
MTDKSPHRQDKVTHDWKKEIDSYLRVILTLEGRGVDPPSTCAHCTSEAPPIYRCLVCYNGGLMCESCIRTQHTRLPTHRIQRCPLSESAWADDFVIVDCDAVHNVGLDFCRCGATSKSHLFQYEAKISPFEFFKAIARLTDNTGLNPVKDRYPSVLRMVHEWRHLKLLKRMGRGHDPLRGASATTQGECALLCPACPTQESTCPRAGRMNPKKQALDANFRLRRKDVSTNAADPGLSEGFAYFVEDKAFSKYVKQHADEVEPKNTRPGQGYSATGVATVECARHNMKRPSAVCDLQKGERYWSINLMRRLKAIDDKSPLLNEKVKTRYVVPKFHLPAHIAPCQSKFAFMLTPGAGLGDGEAPERGWADTNPLGPSTREMGPGTRRDTLDSHFGDYNWRKITDLGSSLLKKNEQRGSNVAEHVIAHQELEETLDSADVERWKLTMANWEKDPKNPSPFEMIVVRRVMADDETEALKTGMDFSLSSEISPSALISRGLDLEAEQRALKSQMKQVWTHSQDRELTRLQLRSNALIRKIESWYEILQLYIPSSVILRKQQSAQVSVQPYNLPLWLPSEIGSRAICDRRLIEIEYDLRIAQAQEALTNVKRHLQRRVTVRDLKARWLRGQGANTRALSLLGSIEDRISTARDEYRQSRLAIISLEKVLGHSGGERCYPPLEDADIRPMVPEEPEDPKKPNGATRRTLSWIWRQGAAVENQTLVEAENTLAVRVEWGKSKARATRYQEEVLIVREEMNRTSRFLQWRGVSVAGARGQLGDGTGAN